MIILSLEMNKDVSLQPCTAFLKMNRYCQGREVQHMSQYRHLESLVNESGKVTMLQGLRFLFEENMSCTSNVPGQMRSRCTKIELIAGHC